VSTAPPDAAAGRLEALTGSPAGLAGAFALVVALAAGAHAAGPGALQLGLAVACVAAGAGVAVVLPLPRRLALLAVTALALRFALPAAGEASALSWAAALLRQLAYYALPPLAVHLVLALRGRRGLPDFGLTAIAFYAPMPVVFLALAGYETLLQRPAAGGGLARTFYAAVYAALLLALLLRELRAPARAPAPPKERAAALEQAGRFGLAQRYYAQTDRLDKAAEMAERAGEWGRAADLYRRTGDLFRAAEMAFRAERFEQALELYEQTGAHAAAARTAERLGLAERAARLYERAGDAASAVRVIEAAGARPSGELYARADRLEEAVVAWQEEGNYARAAETLAHDFEDLEGAAQVYFNGGLYRRAAELFERLGNAPAAIAAYLGSPDTYVDAARLCVETGDLDRAGEIVAGLPAASVEALDDDATLLMLARVEERTGRHEQALRLLQKLRRRREPPPGVFLPLGRCLLARGLVDLAEENLRTAVELQLEGGDEMEAAYLLGTVLEQRGKKAEAAEVFLDLLRKDLGYRDVEARYRRLTHAA
jgi:tetratricopeptide (TPR) repeat protein